VNISLPNFSLKKGLIYFCDLMRLVGSGSRLKSDLLRVKNDKEINIEMI
jgi:hypothetical protein